MVGIEGGVGTGTKEWVDAATEGRVYMGTEGESVEGGGMLRLQREGD